MLPFPVTCKTNIDEYYVCDTPYNLSGLKFHVRHTPGHSIGGISLVFEEEELIFSGDALLLVRLEEQIFQVGITHNYYTPLRQNFLAFPTIIRFIQARSKHNDWKSFIIHFSNIKAPWAFYIQLSKLSEISLKNISILI